MSNYSQNVFFTPKDSLTTGDPNKKIKGSEMDGELSRISTAIASKEDTANKNVTNGYAGLDSGGKVLTSVLPSVVVRTDQVNTFVNGQRVETTAPYLYLKETDATVDNKTWRFYVDSATFALQTVNDAENATANIFTVTRSGNTSASFNITATNINVTGSFAVTGAASVSGTLTGAAANFSGAVTAASITIGGNAVLTTASALNASNLTSGTIPDARIAVTGVTQHQASLSIATSQLTGTLADARLVSSNVTQFNSSIIGRNISSKTGTTKTLSSAAPSGGSDGDIWYQY